MRTLTHLDAFPEEAALIGRLLLAYGELEWTMSLCLSAVLDDETEKERQDRAARTFYRMRGEEFRIVVADSLMREKFRKADLEPPYSEFVADLGYCKTIRNQYAHSHWITSDDGRLCFFSFEEGAKKGGEFSMKSRPLDLPLLRRQELYFNFVWVGLMLLYRRYEHFMGRDGEKLWEFPKKLDRPPLFVESDA